MKMEEFKKYLESLECIETQIVYIKYKYSWEENWTYSNEILEVDMNTDGYYAWASDWNEGQEDIEILGCIALSDIYVPKFPEQMAHTKDGISACPITEIKDEVVNKITINKEDFAILCICAIRYCQGRETYMPKFVRDIVRNHLQNLDYGDLQVMLQDCEFQRNMNLYGDEWIDKPGWLRWKQDLKDEIRRRSTEDEYERAIEQIEHDNIYEPTYNQEDGSI